MMEKKLERNQQNKMIAGVASGLAEYLDVDVTIVRIAFLIFAFFGIAEFIYIIMWIAVPERPFFKNYTPFNTDYKVKEEPFIPQQPIYTPEKSKSNSGRVTVGLVLIAIGVWFMLAEFDIIPDWFSIVKFWPVLLIVLGVVILSGAKKKKEFRFDDIQSPVNPQGATDVQDDVNNQTTA